MSKKPVSLTTKYRMLKIFTSLGAVLFISAWPQLTAVIAWLVAVCCFFRYAFLH